MADGAFHWELIDHRLVGLKLVNLAEEESESIRAEIGQIQFDNIGNSNSQAVPSQIIAMHLRRTEESIEKTYRIYCEVWEMQGHKKTAEFVRAVSSHVIPIIISARTGSVISQLSSQLARTGSQIEPHNARMPSFKQSMSRLAARCASNLEIEARECEHSERASLSNHQNGFDQRENLRKAIAGRKAVIERINRNLDNLPAPGSSSRFGQPVQISQQSIDNLIRRRQEHEATLAELEREEARLSALEGRAREVRNGDAEQILPRTAPAAQLQKVAPGVAKLSLVDLNAPIGSTLKETKHRLTALGALTRKLMDSRILEAAEYKLRNPSCTYAEASIKFFETPGRADSIRYWVNKRKSRGSDK